MVEATEKPDEKAEVEEKAETSKETDEKSKDPAPKQPEEEWNKLMGDNIQMKLLSKDGEKGAECQPQDAAVIDFVGRLAPERDDEDGPIFHEAKDWLIVVGDKYVNPALEMGARFLYEGQIAVVWSHSKFVYGFCTRKWNDYELPPNSNVRYEITCKSIISPKEETANPDGFQLKLALSKKVIANDMFKNELYAKQNSNSESRALRLYSKAADEMLHLLQTHAQRQKKEEDYKEEDHADKLKQATEIMIDSLNNITAVHLKAKKYHEAKEAAVKVLTHDPQNFKALIRAARAAMLDPSGTYEESDAAIEAAEKVVEEKKLDDKEVRKLRQELKQKKQEYKKRRKEMMARMTKGVKVKDTPPKAETKESKEAKEQSAALTENSAKDESAEPKEGLDQAVEETNEVVPAYRFYFPYVIQFVFPIILYYLVMMTSKQHVPRDGTATDATMEDEF